MMRPRTREIVNGRPTDRDIVNKNNSSRASTVPLEKVMRHCSVPSHRAHDAPRDESEAPRVTYCTVLHSTVAFPHRPPPLFRSRGARKPSKGGKNPPTNPCKISKSSGKRGRGRRRRTESQHHRRRPSTKPQPPRPTRQSIKASSRQESGRP